jgi:hypothetical protein
MSFKNYSKKELPSKRGIVVVDPKLFVTDPPDFEKVPDLVSDPTINI